MTRVKLMEAKGELTCMNCLGQLQQGKRTTEKEYIWMDEPCLCLCFTGSWDDHDVGGFPTFKGNNNDEGMYSLVCILFCMSSHLEFSLTKLPLAQKCSANVTLVRFSSYMSSHAALFIIRHSRRNSTSCSSFPYVLVSIEGGEIVLSGFSVGVLHC